MLSSEIAKGLMLEYDDLKHQGKRIDLMNELDEILNEQNMSDLLSNQSENENSCGNEI